MSSISAVGSAGYHVPQATQRADDARAVQAAAQQQSQQAQASDPDGDGDRDGGGVDVYG